MDAFSYLSVLLSIIIGLGVTQILAAMGGDLYVQYATPKRFATCCGRSSSLSTATA
jgi:hypothetical protein